MTNAPLPVENRSLARLPCSIAVSDRSQSASVGAITDISIDGIFIATNNPLPQGALVPLVFHLDTEGPPLRPDAEVVRVAADGMGMRFLRMSPKDAKRLRRHVGEGLGIVGSRDAAARLLDVEASVTKPLTDARAIRKILDQVSGQSAFTVLPAERVHRERAKMTRVEEARLCFESQGPCQLAAGEETMVLCTQEFVSYSFRAEVLEVSDRVFWVSMPESLQYSERRSSPRSDLQGGTRVSFPVPWQDREQASWEVCDKSDTGLSFRADPKDAFFWPGTPLPQVTLHDNGSEEALVGVVVKHLTAMVGEDGQPWLKVGVAHGVERTGTATQGESLEGKERAPGLGRTVQRAWERLSQMASYLYHTKAPVRGAGEGVAFNVVRFDNAAGNPLVGLLNTTQGAGQRIRAPLVIVAPGFGQRKETMSALAATLIDHFRRQHRDVAVLRYDGSNNLGESFKSPGCRERSRHTMQFTLSNGLEDFLGAIKWAKDNRFVDPTEVVVVSSSLASISVGRALTLPEASIVSRWVAFMGAADGPNTCMHASGNIDGWGNHLRGVKTGVVAVLGCLTDVDHLCADMAANKIGTLEQMRADMGQIKADTTWMIGKQDAFVDARRVRDIMTVKAPGKRHIIEVDAGHVPQTSDEALSEFALITRMLWAHLYGRGIEVKQPNRGWLAALSEREWERVRDGVPAEPEAWWRDYLIGDGGLGYDVWSMTHEYQQLVRDQVAAVPASAQQVLDLGAGTGNVTQALVGRGIPDLTALDLVPEALARIALKVGEGRVKTVAHSAEGSPRIAVARWLRGDLGDLRMLADRLPASAAEALQRVAVVGSPRLHSYLRGAQIDVMGALREAKLPGHLQAPLQDVHTLARLSHGLMTQEEAVQAVSGSFRDAAQSGGGLPFANATFDAVTCSLVLSYLKRPDDALSEISRILRPGGHLIISSVSPDADTSHTFMRAIEFFETAEEKDLPPGHARQELIDATRRFLGTSAQLIRLEEEGSFNFWSGPELSDMVRQAGFEEVEVIPSYGDPPMAVIVRCKKP